MTDKRRHSARWLTKRLAAAHQVLDDPTTSSKARRGARCRLNAAIKIMRALPPVPAMKRELEVDRLAEKARRRAKAAA